MGISGIFPTMDSVGFTLSTAGVWRSGLFLKGVSTTLRAQKTQESGTWVADSSYVG